MEEKVNSPFVAMEALLKDHITSRHTAEFFVPLRIHLAAALVLSRKLSANMCKGLLYLQRVED